MAKKPAKKVVTFKKATRRRPVATSERRLVQQLRDAIEADGRPWAIIADESGLSRSIIARFMTGDTDIALTNASLIAEHLGYALVRIRANQA